MKKFKFSLEKVLEIKEVEEKIIQKNLLLIQLEIAETEKKIITLREKISSEREKIGSMSLSVINTGDIMLHYKYIDCLNMDVEILSDVLKGLRLQEITIKNQLIEKSKEKKSLERLKEIKYEEFKKEYNKTQRQFIDDISIQSHRYKEGII
ncbi:MAG: flagellar export protein FliJ [Candidatus Cloacimonetes bacterium]|nr:flagellar export protein FliJ [Candidatus Cloacimonadota bacterium]